jgi:hypothetical protein
LGIENFIKDALYKPNDYIGYHVGRKLAELHPDKSVVAGQTWYFDLEDFVSGGHCSVIPEKTVFQEMKTEWEGAGSKLTHSIENAWLNVLWKGHLINVVLITWLDPSCRRRHHWIIADEKQIAEDFFTAVCEWSCEVRGEILVYRDAEFRKDKKLFESIRNATFDNLILPDLLKQQIQSDFQQFFDSREVYERYKIPWKRGATTNHPEKLDSSILDRPSRFDRKYYFQLPADAERSAYVARWNCELQPEMRVSEEGAARLVSETHDFSFAYLKELLVSSMVQWVSLGGSRSMDEVILAQTDLLRKQISDSSRK